MVGFDAVFFFSLFTPLLLVLYAQINRLGISEDFTLILSEYFNWVADKAKPFVVFAPLQMHLPCRTGKYLLKDNSLQSSDVLSGAQSRLRSDCGYC